MLQTQGLLSVKDFSNLFDPPLSKDYVYTLIHEKKIKAIQPRRKMYIPVAEANRLLTQYEVS